MQALGLKLASSLNQVATRLNLMSTKINCIFTLNLLSLSVVVVSGCCQWWLSLAAALNQVQITAVTSHND